jgi:voltage-gated potassium channel Kch
VTFSVLGRVVRIRTVDLHALAGALSVYLLIGFTFGWALRALSLLSENQALSSDPGTDFIYASFITLTTVGFGDIVPLTSTARRLIIVEALIGQIFLATVVARFVSLFRLEQDDP